MKAAVINEYGDSKAIKVVDDFKEPAVSDNTVLIQVHSAGINPFDAKVASGKVPLNTPLAFPKVLGMDLAGEISEVGSKVSDFKVGDEVYGEANFFSGGGSIAEFTTAKPSSLSLKPSNVNFAEAAALVLTGVSAYQALVDNMHIAASQKILIHGGAGGIGSLAIQLAKHLGAYVATTVSGEDLDYAKQLGADLVVDFTKEDFVEKLKDYDFVFDVIGGEVYKKSFEVLKKGGVIVSMVAPTDEDLMVKYGVRAIHQSTDIEKPDLEKLSELVEQGAIKAQINKTFPIEQTPIAFDLLVNGHSRGKIIINVIN